jgi:D-beta-D-heptose 7-phosphate kinase / D-beta-D-heptose 1-phosphate adenosyltransferase
LAAGFAESSSMEQAMHLANLGAREVVGRVGTYALTRADLEKATALGTETGSAACTLPQAQRLVEHWRMLGQSVVFTNGCFDILHPGHISLLQRAKNLGHKLIVGLNTDASIQRIKGPSRPILAQEDRAALLSALNCVDAVVLFDEDTPLSLLQALRPDILVKGGDYTPETVVGAELMPTWGGRVEILDLLGEKSTTAIVQKICNGSEDPAWKQLP